LARELNCTYNDTSYTIQTVCSCEYIALFKETMCSLCWSVSLFNLTVYQQVQTC